MPEVVKDLLSPLPAIIFCYYITQFGQSWFTALVWPL